MKSKREEAEREERRNKVAANLLAGLNYREMAEHLSCSIATISRDVKLLLGRWQKENIGTIDQWHSLQVKRLDRAINALWTKVEGGDVNAIASLQAVIKQQAQLLGYDKVISLLHLNADLDKLPDDVIEALARGEHVDLTTIAGAGRTGTAQAPKGQGRSRSVEDRD